MPLAALVAAGIPLTRRARNAAAARLILQGLMEP
jgi:hypothetical protein